MAAKIRAMELLPNAVTDMEYLKLYGVVFLGWLLTTVGSHMFFKGVPVLSGFAPSVSLVFGTVFGGIAWLLGAVPLLGGLVALARKVILETTRDELVDIDRVVDGTAAASTTGGTDSSGSSVDESSLRAGARPSETTGGSSNSRVENAPGEGSSHGDGSSGDAPGDDGS